MPTPSTPVPDAPTPTGESERLPLVIVHLVLSLSSTKGWRVQARIQDGWQGPMLSHWSRGGSDVLCGMQKALGDLEAAYTEAMEALGTF